jgi:hypothetical protein
METSRIELKKYSGKREKFFAEFSQVSISKIRRDIVILMYNVTDSTQKLVAQHMWSTINPASLDKRLGGIKPGQKISFEGVVHSYTKSTGERTVGIDDAILLY